MEKIKETRTIASHKEQLKNITSEDFIFIDKFMEFHHIREGQGFKNYLTYFLNDYKDKKNKQIAKMSQSIESNLSNAPQDLKEVNREEILEEHKDFLKTLETKDILDIVALFLQGLKGKERYSTDSKILWKMQPQIKQYFNITLVKPPKERIKRRLKDTYNYIG